MDWKQQENETCCLRSFQLYEMVSTRSALPSLNVSWYLLSMTYASSTGRIIRSMRISASRISVRATFYINAYILACNTQPNVNCICCYYAKVLTDAAYISRMRGRIKQKFSSQLVPILAFLILDAILKPMCQMSWSPGTKYAVHQQQMFGRSVNLTAILP